MIAKIEGEIVRNNGSYLVVSAGGVGYKIHCLSAVLDKHKEGAKVALWTHSAIRENAFDLYGFISKDEIDLFELLLTVSGIGPKTALNIMNVASPEILRKSILTGNAGYLVKMSGIGKKNAEKIVLELHGKVGSGTEEGMLVEADDSDVLEALFALGYSQKAARDALKEVSAEIESESERIKEALKILTTKK